MKKELLSLFLSSSLTLLSGCALLREGVDQWRMYLYDNYESLEKLKDVPKETYEVIFGETSLLNKDYSKTNYFHFPEKEKHINNFYYFVKK
ncbi:MAG: hypothetical protein QW273_02160 [Candidatus Pacearchaeota archaeon]